MNNLEKNTPNNNKPENPGRRGFIRGILGGAIATALGTKGVNKYMEKEKQLSDLYTYFEGKESDFGRVNYAADMLKQEMSISNIQKVKLTGTGSSNERIDILRDYLTRHLNSPAGNKHNCRQVILNDGYYTTKNLTQLAGESIDILNQENNQRNYEESLPADTNISIVKPKSNSQYLNKNIM